MSNQFHNDLKKYIPYPYDYLLMTFLGYLFTGLFISNKNYISLQKTKPIIEKNILIIDKKIKDIFYNIEKKYKKNINNNNNNNNVQNNNIIFNKNKTNNKNQKNKINNDSFNNLNIKINNLKNKITLLKNKNEEQNKNLDNIIKIQFEIYQKIFPETPTPK